MTVHFKKVDELRIGNDLSVYDRVIEVEEKLKKKKQALKNKVQEPKRNHKIELEYYPTWVLD